MQAIRAGFLLLCRKKSGRRANMMLHMLFVRYPVFHLRAYEQSRSGNVQRPSGSKGRGRRQVIPEHAARDPNGSQQRSQRRPDSDLCPAVIPAGDAQPRHHDRPGQEQGLHATRRDDGRTVPGGRDEKGRQAVRGWHSVIRKRRAIGATLVDNLFEGVGQIHR